jgi:hypothetical protein
MYCLLDNNATSSSAASIMTNLTTGTGSSATLTNTIVPAQRKRSNDVDNKNIPDISSAYDIQRNYYLQQKDERKRSESRRGRIDYEKVKYKKEKRARV